MKTEKPDEKGFIAILKEAFTKSGGCCGAGQGNPKGERKPTSPRGNDAIDPESPRMIQRFHCEPSIQTP